MSKTTHKYRQLYRQCYVEARDLFDFQQPEHEEFLLKYRVGDDYKVPTTRREVLRSELTHDGTSDWDHRIHYVASTKKEVIRHRRRRYSFLGVSYNSPDGIVCYYV